MTDSIQTNYSAYVDLGNIFVNNGQLASYSQQSVPIAIASSMYLDTYPTSSSTQFWSTYSGEAPIAGSLTLSLCKSGYAFTVIQSEVSSTSTFTFITNIGTAGNYNDNSSYLKLKYYPDSIFINSVFWNITSNPTISPTIYSLSGLGQYCICINTTNTIASNSCIQVSNNYCISWSSEISFFGINSSSYKLTSVAISTTGNYVVATLNNSTLPYFIYSQNYGVSWFQSNLSIPTSSLAITSVFCNDTYTVILLNKTVYYTLNTNIVSGTLVTLWLEITFSSNTSSITNLSFSSSNNILGYFNNTNTTSYVFYSTLSTSATWNYSTLTPISSPNIFLITSISINSIGTNALFSSSTNIYYSYDSGNNWTLSTLPTGVSAITNCIIGSTAAMMSCTLSTTVDDTTVVNTFIVYMSNTYGISWNTVASADFNYDYIYGTQYIYGTTIISANDNIGLIQSTIAYESQANDNASSLFLAF